MTKIPVKPLFEREDESLPLPELIGALFLVALLFFITWAVLAFGALAP